MKELKSRELGNLSKIIQKVKVESEDPNSVFRPPSRARSFHTSLN